MIDLSVVIVNYNTRETLARTLTAVLDDVAGLGAEVIVVDNASEDGSARMVRERFPSVQLQANATNTFYAAGNNQGLRSSRGRFALVLNPDAEPRPGTLPAMVAYLDRHAPVGALSVRLCFPDGRVQHNCSRAWTYAGCLLESTPLGAVRPDARRQMRRWARYEPWDRSSERDVDVLPGSCLMVRRSVLDRVGAFDERFRLYFAEDDWCLRIRAAGFIVRYAPVGTVVHPESESVAQSRRLARRLYLEDMGRYARKHFGRRRAILLNAMARPWRWAHDVAGGFRRP